MNVKLKVDEIPAAVAARIDSHPEEDCQDCTTAVTRSAHSPTETVVTVCNGRVRKVVLQSQGSGWPNNGLPLT